ncbi:Sec1 family protein [Tritrichomonas foetus]|uniref:Sec1 family protein n=1 Tax=Tritrichomonas foetus TaxID=1144522 RepID=A0A1J4KY47_9EUKA|nr:Sec1 family protein [Tritrichomonas foetus]|eukprot:OHT14638.1 Sec1 family protein [Tritrichomonas foetus]
MVIKISQSMSYRMLRKKQQIQLLRILNCNSPPTRESQLIWKVLIHDKYSKNVLRSAFDENFDVLLSKNGVTYHADINLKRSRIRDVPVVYLVEANENNLNLILKDIESNIYDSFYINFISKIDNELLRDFAKEVATKSDGRAICGVFDSYLDFISEDDRKFELFDNSNSLFESIYDRSQQLSSLTIICDKITEKLLSVVKTIGQIPLIMSKGDLAKICNDMLKEKITNQITKNPNFLQRNERPLILIFDRSFDFLTMVHHATTYDSLIDDLLGIESRKNDHKNDEKNNDDGFLYINNGEFRIDKKNDAFWKDNRHKPFDQVLLNINELVQNFRKDYKSIENDIGGAMAEMSGIKERQESVTTHPKICDRLLSIIREKKIDKLFKFEVDCISKSSCRFSDCEIDTNTLTTKDKLRLLAVAYMTGSLSNNDGELNNNEFSFLKNLEMFKTFSQQDTGIVASVIGRFGRFSDNGTSLLSKMPIVDFVRRAMAGNDEGFDISNISPESPNVRKNAIVFIIGPGCMSEFDGFEMLNEEKKAEGVEIEYGCTTMLRPTQFAEELVRVFQ